MENLFTGSALDKRLGLPTNWTAAMWAVGLIEERGWRGRTQPLFRQVDVETILHWPQLDDAPHPEALRLRINAWNWDKSRSTMGNANKFRGLWMVSEPERYDWLVLSCMTVTVAVYRITGFTTTRRRERRFKVAEAPDDIQKQFVHKLVESKRGSGTMHIPEVK